MIHRVAGTCRPHPIVGTYRPHPIDDARCRICFRAWIQRASIRVAAASREASLHAAADDKEDNDAALRARSFVFGMDSLSSHSSAFLRTSFSREMKEFEEGTSLRCLWIP